MLEKHFPLHIFPGSGLEFYHSVLLFLGSTALPLFVHQAVLLTCPVFLV